MTEQTDKDSEKKGQTRLSVVLVSVLVVVGVLFTLFSLIDTLLSAPETWHRFAAFVSDHTSFLSDEQVAYLRNGLLLVGSCMGGFALGRMRRNGKLNKWWTGGAFLCIGMGVALTGAAAIEKLDPAPEGKIGLSPAKVLKETKQGDAPRSSNRVTAPDDSAEAVQVSTAPSGSSFQSEASPSTASGCVCPAADSVPAEPPEPSGGSTEIVEVNSSETESRSESGSTVSESSTESSSETSATSMSESRSESRSESSSEVTVE